MLTVAYWLTVYPKQDDILHQLIWWGLVGVTLFVSVLALSILAFKWGKLSTKKRIEIAAIAAFL
jgi:hypothetical protein